VPFSWDEIKNAESFEKGAGVVRPNRADLRRGQEIDGLWIREMADRPFSKNVNALDTP